VRVKRFLARRKQVDMESKRFPERDIKRQATSLGRRLKEAREAKDLSLEQVHKLTKIHPRILKALEEDDFESVNPIYAKGFLKIYARLLDLDSQKIIEGFQSHYRATPKAEEVKEEVSSPEKIKFKPRPAKQPSFHTFGLPRLLFFFIPLAVIGSFLFFLIVLKKSPSEERLKKPAPQKELRGVSEKSSSPASKQKDTVEHTRPVLPRHPKVTVELHFKEDSWIEVKVDGKTIVSNVLPKGSSDMWQAQNSIELSLGNPSAVELVANGQLISKLGRARGPIQKILITRDGMSIDR
jgi:cytoskeletal protein RodZ